MSPTWLRTRVRKYAALVELGFVPRVVFSEKEWRRATPKKQWRMAAGGDTAGCTWDGIVYINKAVACCRRNADDTAAHEVVHMRYSDLRHSPKFYRYITEIQLGRVPE